MKTHADEVSHFVLRTDMTQGDINVLKEKVHHFVQSYVQRHYPGVCKEIRTEVRGIRSDGFISEYEIKIEFLTDKGLFHSKRVGWNLYLTFKDALDAIKFQSGQTK